MSAAVARALAEFRSAFAQFQQASSAVLGAARRLSIALDVVPTVQPEIVILDVVSEVFGLPQATIIGWGKQPHIVEARWTVFFLCRHVLGWKYQRIADAYHVKVHSTVQFALKRFPDRRADCPVYNAKVTEAERRVTLQLREAA